MVLLIWTVLMQVVFGQRSGQTNECFSVTCSTNMSVNKEAKTDLSKKMELRCEFL